MTIGNGDDVGWDVSGDITSLGFDDWKGGQGTSSEIVRDLGCTFQKTGVEVENITWVGLKILYKNQLCFLCQLLTSRPGGRLKRRDI